MSNDQLAQPRIVDHRINNPDLAESMAYAEKHDRDLAAEVNSNPELIALGLRAAQKYIAGMMDESKYKYSEIDKMLGLEEAHNKLSGPVSNPSIVLGALDSSAREKSKKAEERYVKRQELKNEVDRFASEMGIDPEDLTQQQKTAIIKRVKPLLDQSKE